MEALSKSTEEGLKQPLLERSTLEIEYWRLVQRIQLVTAVSISKSQELPEKSCVENSERYGYRRGCDK